MILQNKKKVYATEAVLLTKNLKFSLHKGVISLFGQYFVKTSIFLCELSRDLVKAQDRRLAEECSFKFEITREAAENESMHVKKFFIFTPLLQLPLFSLTCLKYLLL